MIKPILTIFLTRSATISVNEGPPIILRYNNTIRLQVSFIDKHHQINTTDWEQIQKHIGSKSRPEISGYLLASSRQLFSEGYRRSSLLEAIVALEISLYDFVDNNMGCDLPEHIINRISKSSIKTLIGEAGLRAYFGFIIPMLIPESVLPLHILQDCRSAIDARNNVAHNKQRDVNAENLNR